MKTSKVPGSQGPSQFPENIKKEAHQLSDNFAVRRIQKSDLASPPKPTSTKRSFTVMKESTETVEKTEEVAGESLPSNKKSRPS